MSSQNKTSKLSLFLSKRKTLVAAAAAAVIVVVAVVMAAIWIIPQALSSSGDSSDASQTQATATPEATPEIAKFASGISIGGIDVSGKTEEQALKLLQDSEEKLIGTYEVTVTYGEESIKITQDDMAFTFDLEKAVTEAMKFSDSLTEDATAKKDFPLTPEINYDGVKTRLDEFTATIEKTR